MEEDSKKKQIIAIVLVLIVVILVFGGLALTQKDDRATNNSEPTTPTTTEVSTDTNSSSETNTAGYKDGTYSATGSYTSPGGREKITISVTLKNGKVAETSATQGATDDEAEEYQGKFIAGYKSQVVGKDVDSVSLSRVSGSSLTSQGFNSAIEQIKTQAKA